MRTVSGSDSALLSTGTLRVWVANSSGTLVDLSASLVGVDYEDPTADQPIGAATITFRRGEGASSLAPLMTATPPLDIKRAVMVEVDPGSGTFREVFRGKIDRIDWRNRFGDVVIECRDQAGDIQDTFIEAVRSYGSESGVALETVIQQVHNDNLTTPPTLYTPTATSAVVAPAYEQQQESTFQATRTLAESIGWTHRYRFIEALSGWRMTLFEPARSKAVSDFTFGTSDYYDVSELNIDVDEIRNAIEVDSPNADGTRGSTLVEDAASIAKYGRRYMKLVEGDDSPIVGATKRTALANAALSDLAEPEATLEITSKYFWPGEVGIDLYTFTANDKHFSSDQTLAPTAIRHSLKVGQRWESRVLVRGKPSGGQYQWRERARKGREREGLIARDMNALSDIKLIRDVAAGTWTLTWTRGGKVERVLVWMNEMDETSTTNPHAITGDPVANLEDGTDTYTGSIPSRGKYLGVVLIPYDEAGKPGPMWKGFVNPAAGIAARKDFLWDVPAIGSADLHGRFTDDQEQAGTLYVWVNPDGYALPDFEGAADGQVAFNGGSAFEFGPATVFTDSAGTSVGTILNDIPNSVSDPKTVAVEVISADGRTTGQIQYTLRTPLALVDDLGVLERYQITQAWQFADLFKMPRLYANAASLPADNADSDYAVALDTGQGYKWNTATEAWDTYDIETNANVGFFPVLLAGIIKTIHLEALSVTTEILASTAVTTEKLDAGAVTAAKMTIAALSEISDDAGIILTGMLRNAAGTAMLNLDATAGGGGDDGINLKVPGLTSYANGTLLLTNPLSEANDDLGTMVAGLIQNDPSTPTAGIRVDSASALPGGWSTYLDLAATGSGAVLAHGELSLNADGTADWSTAVLNPPRLTAASVDGNWTGTGTNFTATWSTDDLVGGETVDIFWYRAGSNVGSETGVDATLGTFSEAAEIAGGSSGDLVSGAVALYSSAAVKQDERDTMPRIQTI